MNIVEATRRYEGWMAAQVPVRPKDLQLKHESMASNVFPFLRATFYRWVQLWNELCPELAAAPALLAVGDLHVDNFGTWRDLEGRLIWGVNDFDEAYSMPYTIDLVRLAASAIIAAEEEDLSLAPADVSAMVLDGYREAMERDRKSVV